MPTADQTNKTKRVFNTLSILILTASQTACAVHGNGGKGTQYGIDEAALFGEQLTEFVLPDGTVASLRSLHGRYSVKFSRFSRVVEIDKAVSVKFKSTAQVDGFSLVILEKSEPNCPKMTELLAVRGQEVRVWDLGNCKTDPQLAISPSDAKFDVRDGNVVTRYVYQDGQLSYGNLAYQAPLYEPPRPSTVSNSPTGAQRSDASPAPDKAEAPTQTKSAGTKVETKRFEQPNISSTVPTFKTKVSTPKTIYMDK